MEKSIKLSKIINDPVHGFIEVPKKSILPVIDTEVFQRLRRIKQLGLSSLVYPGATHTRFNHALGAMHLMRQALEVLRRKDVPISDEEYTAGSHRHFAPRCGAWSVFPRPRIGHYTQSPSRRHESRPHALPQQTVGWISQPRHRHI